LGAYQQKPILGVFMENHIYWTPKQVVTSGKYPFTMGQIRHLLLYRHRNGLAKATRKIGKRLMLRLDLFDAWIDSYGARSK
jgi:hypothetical protein